MNRWYSLSWNKIVEAFKSNEKRGLSFKQLEINRKAKGKNSLKINNKSKKTDFEIIKEEIFLIPFFVGFILIFLGLYIEAMVVLIIALGATYFAVKGKKERLKELETINNLNYTDVWVMRAGIRDLVKAEDLVIGDIVILKPNNIIPADIRIIDSKNLKINERNVLGEEFISLKNPGRIDGNVNSIKEIYNMAFRGTRVVSGEGKGIVVEVGSKTNIGNIVKYFELFNNNLEKKEKSFTAFKKNFNILALMIIIISFFIFKFFNLNNYKILFGYFVFIIGTMNLLEISNSIALNYKYKKFNEIGINNLNKDGLNYLDNIDVIFLDKLGSITENEMKVKYIYSDRKIEDSKKINKNNINMERLISIVVLCNNAKYNKATESYLGDLKEGATLKFAIDNNIFKASMEGKNKRIFEVVNNLDKEIKTTINKVNKNYRAQVRGSLEEVLSRSSFIMLDGIEKPLSNEEIENIKMIDFNFANEGLVTEAIAYRSFNYQPTEDENIENNLVFVGLIAYENPKKENVQELITEIKKRSIIPILITDDNKITAYRIAKEAGIVNNMSEVVTAVEMLNLNKDEIIDVLARGKVFCKITANIRNKIVEIFTENKYKLCTTGENLSHIPSILLSEVSIAKGKSSAALVNTLSTMNIEDDILEKVLFLYDNSKQYKINLEKTLTFFKKVLLIEMALIAILVAIFDLNLKWYILLFNIIFIPIFLITLILYYDKLQEKIIETIEFILNKWKRFKER